MSYRKYLMTDDVPPSELYKTVNIDTDSDTISRAKAIEVIDEIESEIAEGFGFEYEKWRKYFCDLPPAQPERIRGRWIAKEKKNLFRCSKCDAVIYSESEYDRNEFHKFCGRCGAEMREVTT